MKIPSEMERHIGFLVQESGKLEICPLHAKNGPPGVGTTVLATTTTLVEDMASLSLEFGVRRGNSNRADLIYVDSEHSYLGCQRKLNLNDPIPADDGVFLCGDHHRQDATVVIDQHITKRDYNNVIAWDKILMSRRRDILAIGSFRAKTAVKHA